MESLVANFSLGANSSVFFEKLKTKTDIEKTDIIFKDY